jgi:hypothetical protein
MLPAIPTGTTVLTVIRRMAMGTILTAIRHTGIHRMDIRHTGMVRPITELQN